MPTQGAECHFLLCLVLRTSVWPLSPSWLYSCHKFPVHACAPASLTAVQGSHGLAPMGSGPCSAAAGPVGCSQRLHVLEAQERMGVRCQRPECGAGQWEKSNVLLLLPGILGASLGAQAHPTGHSLCLSSGWDITLERSLVVFKDHWECSSKGRMNLLLPHVFSSCRH